MFSASLQQCHLVIKAQHPFYLHQTYGAFLKEMGLPVTSAMFFENPCGCPYNVTIEKKSITLGTS